MTSLFVVEIPDLVIIRRVRGVVPAEYQNTATQKNNLKKPVESTVAS